MFTVKTLIIKCLNNVIARFVTQKLQQELGPELLCIALVAFGPYCLQP